MMRVAGWCLKLETGNSKLAVLTALKKTAEKEIFRSYDFQSGEAAFHASAQRLHCGLARDGFGQNAPSVHNGNCIIMTVTVLEVGTAFLGGTAIGLLFFGGLYWAVRKLPSVKRPWLWMTASFWLRIAVAGAAFYAISAGRWERVLVSLVGFLLVRTVMLRKIKPKPSVSNT
jgi:F1F0 ATPase subunit 2